MEASFRKRNSCAENPPYTDDSVNVPSFLLPRCFFNFLAGARYKTMPFQQRWAVAAQRLLLPASRGSPVRAAGAVRGSVELGAGGVQNELGR